jgi:hypothetical protein
VNDHVIMLSRAIGAAHYLCGWCTSDDPPDEEWQSTRDAAHQVPVWLSTRDKAITYDEQTAAGIAGQLRVRYRCPSSGIRVSAEALRR